MTIQQCSQFHSTAYNVPIHVILTTFSNFQGQVLIPFCRTILKSNPKCLITLLIIKSLSYHQAHVTQHVKNVVCNVRCWLSSFIPFSPLANCISHFHTISIVLIKIIQLHPCLKFKFQVLDLFMQHVLQCPFNVIVSSHFSSHGSFTIS